MQREGVKIRRRTLKSRVGQGEGEGGPRKGEGSGSRTGSGGETRKGSRQRGRRVASSAVSWASAMKTVLAEQCTWPQAWATSIQGPSLRSCSNWGAVPPPVIILEHRFPRDLHSWPRASRPKRLQWSETRCLSLSEWTTSPELLAVLAIRDTPSPSFLLSIKNLPTPTCFSIKKAKQYQKGRIFFSIKQLYPALPGL